jgi:hypothetical protein
MSAVAKTLYHHTTQMHLPRILRDGELRPLVIRKKTRDYYRSLSHFRNSGDAPDFVHATTNPDHERTSTVDMGGPDEVGNVADKIVRVRFTLQANDFEPWREVLARYPQWTPEAIKAHEKVGRERGSDVRGWYCRAEPLKCDRWIAIHYKRPGDDQWLLCPMDATIFSVGDDIRNSALMGVVLGNDVHWSKHFIDDKIGLDGYSPAYITDAAKTLAAVEVNESLSESSIRKLAAPVKTPTLPAIFADPFANPTKYIKPKPAPLPASKNAKRMTTDVRYVITEDTFRRYPADDIETEKAELIEAGLWKVPNGDQPYTIRMSFYALGELLDRFRRKDFIGNELWKAEKREAAQLKREQWLDFDMRGDELLCVTRVFREQLNGRDVDKRYCIENTATNLDDLRENGGLDPDSRQAWWEKGNWLNQRFVEIGLPGKEFIAEGLLDILVLALMDKSVSREKTPRPVLSSAWQPGGWLYSKELDTQEVTIRCPGFYRERGEIGEATGRRVKMHRRRGHMRTYHRGLPKEFSDYIQPMWINAIAGVEPPPVIYTVRAS